MARLSSVGLGALLLLGLCLVGSVSGAMNLSSQPRQSAPAPVSTSLVANTVSSVASLRKILLPAIQSLIGAPLQILRQLLLELANYVRTHSLSDLYSVKTLRVLVSRLPERVHNYWIMLTEMESQCLQRTLCDLGDFSSKRFPTWIQQIVLIYLNNFSESHPHYMALISGLTTHNCHKIYDDCDAQQFMDRVSGNLSLSLATTVGPVKEAFEGLVNVTATTLSTLLVEPSADRPNVSGSAVLARPGTSNGRMDDADEEEEGRTFDEFSRRPNSMSNSRGRFDGPERQSGEQMMKPGTMRRPPVAFPRS